MSKEDVAANPNFDQIDYCKHDEDEEGSDDEQKELEINLSQLSIEEKDEIGLSAASWLSFLEGFQSRDIYVKKVLEFAHFFVNDSANYPTKNADMSLVAFFQSMHDKSISPSSLQSWLAIYKKFWIHTGKGDIKYQVINEAQKQYCC
jgi:hypothetical protein